MGPLRDKVEYPLHLVRDARFGHDLEVEYDRSCAPKREVEPE